MLPERIKYQLFEWATMRRINPKYLFILASLMLVTLGVSLFANDLSQTGKAGELSYGTEEGGSISVNVVDADSGRPIKYAEVTLYDDSLTEIETQEASRKGLAVFKNEPIQFTDEILSLYEENGKDVPAINMLDSRIYYIDVAAEDYGPQIVEYEFVEGNKESLTVYLSKGDSGFSGSITGDAVRIGVAKKEPEVFHFPKPGGVLLKLGPHEQLTDSPRCRLLVDAFSASSVPEDGKPFEFQGFLRDSKYCSGTYKVSMSLDSEKHIIVKGKGRMPFTIGPFSQSFGNAAGGLACPFIEVVELLDESQTSGDSISVGFRLPVLACNDPEICLGTARCMAANEGILDGESTRPVKLEENPEGTCDTLDPSTGEAVKGTMYSGITACSRYFNGDCLASSRGGLCEFEQDALDPWCSNTPKRGGSPGGGGRELIEQSILQDIGKQCCFCLYDSKGKDSEELKKSCGYFFDGTIKPLPAGTTLNCEVKEEIPIQNIKTGINEVAKKYLCKRPPTVFISAHGYSSSLSVFKYDSSSQLAANSGFTATCQNFREVTTICASTFPGQDMLLQADSCMVFEKEDEIVNYLRNIPLDEYQVVNFVGNILYGWFNPEMEDSCTLKRIVTVSPQCMSITPGSCRKHGATCGTSAKLGIAHPCIDQNGVRTTQRCCGEYLFKNAFWNIFFSEPGEECQIPLCGTPSTECEKSDSDDGQRLCRIKTDKGGKLSRQACCARSINGKDSFFVGEVGKSCSEQCLTSINDGCMVNGKESDGVCVYEATPSGTVCKNSDLQACDGLGNCIFVPKLKCTTDSDCSHIATRCADSTLNPGKYYGLYKQSCDIGSGTCKRDYISCYDRKEVCKQVTPTEAECVKEA